MVASEDIGRQILTYGKRYGPVDLFCSLFVSWDAISALGHFLHFGREYACVGIIVSPRIWF